MRHYCGPWSLARVLDERSADACPPRELRTPTNHELACACWAAAVVSSKATAVLMLRLMSGLSRSICLGRGRRRRQGAFCEPQEVLTVCTICLGAGSTTHAKMECCYALFCCRFVIYQNEDMIAESEPRFVLAFLPSSVKKPHFYRNLRQTHFYCFFVLEIRGGVLFPVL